MSYFQDVAIFMFNHTILLWSLSTRSFMEETLLLEECFEPMVDELPSIV
jgi:hypothetical protein